MMLIRQSRRQPHCAQCYRSSLQLPAGKILAACVICHLVSTCSMCTPSHTTEKCKKYQHVGSIENFRISYFNSQGRVYTQAPTEKPRIHHRALSTADSWYEYFTEVSDKRDCVENVITSDFNINIPILAEADAETQASIQRMWLYLVTSTETQSMPLTVLAALEDVIDGLWTKEALTLHFIGAGAKEIRNSVVFEELLHLCPSLSELKLIFVGPESKSTEASVSDTMREMEMGCCAECTTRGKKRTLALSGHKYHDFAKLPDYGKPDLAVLFHSGRSQAEVESWRPTTRYLVHSSIPTVCTTYNEREAIEELAELHLLDARMIRLPEINKWKSLIPRIEPLEGEAHTFYYDNYYRYIFKGLN